MKQPKCQQRFCIHHCSAISKSPNEYLTLTSEVDRPESFAVQLGREIIGTRLSQRFGYSKGYKSDLLSLSWSSVHLRGVYPLFERGLDTGLARRTLLCHHHSCSVYSSDGSHHQRCLQTYRHKNLFREALRDSLNRK